MEVIAPASNDDLLFRCRQVFGENGRLSTAIPGFVARSMQIELAAAIVNAILSKDILVAEAGTGTGKTFAYLIPCILSGKKALVSTATKTLQDQLFHKDIPTLVRALGRSLRVQNLKGRPNYLCLHRIALHAGEGRFVSPQYAHEIIYVKEKISQCRSGERSELPEISEESGVWPYVTSTTDNCLGSECADYQECFLVKARRRAMKADIVVINHHLFFADSCVKEEGFGELLPGVETVIFDEAHSLPEIAAHFSGKRWGTRQLKELMGDILKEWPALDMANQSLKKMSFDFEQAIDQLTVIFSSDEKIDWGIAIRKPQFGECWKNLLNIMGLLMECLENTVVDEHAGLKRCQQRLHDLHDLMKSFQYSDATQIRWIERFKQSLVGNSTPVDVSQSFQKMLVSSCAYLFTSATLTMAASFDCFIQSLGLQQAKTLILPSPFDYRQQALLYLPRALPDPKDPSYYSFLVKKALPIINACGGRCFFLFTSHKALKQVAELLVNNLNYPLLIQGDEAKPILLARFRALGNAVLLGTATFWEGVDVKGDALSCVIIDKLPFANPTDPVVRGKMAYLKAQGMSGFDQLSLPAAVLALKQGVGRLIRDAEDKGILIIADPRLTARDYGHQIFASLPQLRKTRDEQRALNFIQTLALKHEIVST